MKRTTVIVLVFLLALTLLKIYKLDGGFVPAEPDERNYLNIVNNFKQGPLSQFDGVPLYHSPPFFHYLGFLLSFVFPGYLSIRLVSLVASLVLSICLYFYLRSKLEPKIAALSSGLFLLLPIIVYYSRLGLLEMLVSLSAFGFIISFEVAWRSSSWRWAILSGLSLGFGMITKYSILPLIGVPILVLSFYIMEEFMKKRSLVSLFSAGIRRKIVLLFVMGGSALIIFGPVTYFNYGLDPIEFKSQLKQDFALGARSFEWIPVFEYIKNLPSYFSWLGVGLLLVGLPSFLRRWRQNLPVLLSLLLLGYALVRIALYTPRYFVIIVPFLVVIMSFGLQNIWTYLRGWGPIKNINQKRAVVALGVALLLIFLPSSKLALEASHHTTIEEVGTYIKTENKEGKWIGTNYWPSAFVDQAGYKISWLSADHNDSNTLSGGGKTRYESPGEPLFDLISREGGWVIVEEVFSKGISRGRERTGPVEIVQKNTQPTKVFVDTAPNWPYINNSENRISVYHLEGR